LNIEVRTSHHSILKNLILQTQLVLLVILTIALINFVVGSIIGPKNDWDKSRGFLGYSGTFD